MGQHSPQVQLEAPGGRSSGEIDATQRNIHHLRLFIMSCVLPSIHPFLHPPIPVLLKEFGRYFLELVSRVFSVLSVLGWVFAPTFSCYFTCML